MLPTQVVLVWEYNPYLPLDLVLKRLANWKAHIDIVTPTHYDENMVCISAIIVASSTPTLTPSVIQDVMKLPK